MLLQVLGSFTTPALLSLSLVSHRFAALVHRVYHHRLTLAADLAPRSLLLECYHPSLRLVEEPLLCIPLGTPGLERISDSSKPPLERAVHFNALYSHFKPVRRAAENDPRAKMRHPAGDVPGSRTYADRGETSNLERAGAEASAHPEADETSAPITQKIHLDSSELFAQLTAVTSIVQIAPKSGLFLSVVNVSEGVIRMFRDWLSLQKQKEPRQIFAPDTHPPSSIVDTTNLLWVNDGMNVGVRFRVREKRLATSVAEPILVRADEDEAVNYDLDICGEYLPHSH